MIHFNHKRLKFEFRPIKNTIPLLCLGIMPGQVNVWRKEKNGLSWTVLFDGADLVKPYGFIQRIGLYTINENIIIDGMVFPSEGLKELTKSESPFSIAEMDFFSPLTKEWACNALF